MSPSHILPTCLSLLWLFLEQVVAFMQSLPRLITGHIIPCTPNIYWFFLYFIDLLFSSVTMILVHEEFCPCWLLWFKNVLWGGGSDRTKEQHVKVLRSRHAEQMRQQSGDRHQDGNWSRQEAERHWHFIDRISQVTGSSLLTVNCVVAITWNCRLRKHGRVARLPSAACNTNGVIFWLSK